MNYWDNTTKTEHTGIYHGGADTVMDEPIVINADERRVEARTYFGDLFEKINSQENEFMSVYDEIALRCSNLAQSDFSFDQAPNTKEVTTIMDGLYMHYHFKEHFCSSLYNVYEFLCKNFYGESTNVEYQQSLVPFEDIVCIKHFEELFLQQHSFIADLVELIDYSLSKLFLEQTGPEVSGKTEEKYKQYFLSVLIEGNEVLLKRLNELNQKIRQFF
jgi:hypothetical protein